MCDTPQNEMNEDVAAISDEDAAMDETISDICEPILIEDSVVKRVRWKKVLDIAYKASVMLGLVSIAVLVVNVIL